MSDQSVLVDWYVDKLPSILIFEKLSLCHCLTPSMTNLHRVFRFVREEDADTPAFRVANAKSVHVEPAFTQLLRDVLEPYRFTIQRHAAINIEPVLLMIWREVAHPFALSVHQTCLCLESWIDLDKAIIDGLVTIEFHLDDAKSILDGLEQKSILLFALVPLPVALRLAYHRSIPFQDRFSQMQLRHNLTGESFQSIGLACRQTFRARLAVYDAEAVRTFPSTSRSGAPP